MRYTATGIKRPFLTVIVISCATPFLCSIGLTNFIFGSVPVIFQYPLQRAPDYFKAHKLTNCSTEGYRWSDITDFDRLMIVGGDGTLLERVCLFNLALDRVRSHVVNNVNRAISSTVECNNLKEDVRKIISNRDEDFLIKLIEHSQATTVGLAWRSPLTPTTSKPSSSVMTSQNPTRDLVNLLVRDYFIWSASESLCRTVSETLGFDNLKYNGSYRYVCNTNLSAEVISRSQPLPRLFLNAFEFKYVRRYLIVDDDDDDDDDESRKERGNRLLQASPIEGNEEFKSQSELDPKRPSLIEAKQLLLKAPSDINPKQTSPNEVKRLLKASHVHPKQTSPISVYCHVIRDAIVTDEGDVFTRGFKLVSYGCSDNRAPNPPWLTFLFPTYDEVFVVSQHWGAEVFHQMIELMPRVAVFLDFLTRHPEVKIAVKSSNARLRELFQVVGLNSGRIVAGSVRAKVAYVPRPTMCGLANVQELQVLSSIYQRYIVENLYEKSERSEEGRGETSMVYKDRQPEVEIRSSKSTTLISRNKLILIQRSHSRRFTEQAAIEAVTSQAADSFNLEYVLFSDKNLPSLNDTMRLFHEAVMVVAPHGAGLANIVFSRPGTYIIECVCNAPHLNLCLHRTAVLLGHHWHGIPSKQGCESVIYVSADVVEAAILTYLKIWKGNDK